MKKRFLTFILAVASVVSCAFAFSACEGGNPSESSSTPSYGDGGNSSSSGGENLDVLTPEMEDDLSNFYYTFTPGSCVITGLKDNTVTQIVIPDFVTGIDFEAFWHCVNLTNITIPDSVTSIGSWAFWDCVSLTSITIPDSVTSIDKGTFWGCYSLTNVVIPDSVTSIGDSAFESCGGLTSITIPGSVTSIGERAFENCNSLTSITFSDTSTWYRTTSSVDWNNKTGGSQTSVTNSSTNATYFKLTYGSYYWYKL